MQVKVDLSKWIAYSLGSHGQLLLDSAPTVDANPSDTIYDVVDLALETAIRNSRADKEELRIADPFRPTYDLWVLGCPAVVELDGNTLHFIDSIGDLGSSSSSIRITLRPRDDIESKSDALRRLSARFGDAIGLRSLVTDLHIAVVDKVLDMLLDVRFSPTILEALESLKEYQDPNDTLTSDHDPMSHSQAVGRAITALETVRKPIGEYLRPTINWINSTVVGTILDRTEISIYNDFAAKIGSESVRHYWIPFSYPSRVWHEFETGGVGPTLLSEIGSRLWKFNILQQRVKKTENALTRSTSVYDLVDKSIVENLSRGHLGASDFLKSDETVNCWFEKETAALRYYLIGVFSFPESFLAGLKGRDISNYSAEVKKIFRLPKNNVTKERTGTSAVGLPPVEAKEIRITELLQRPFSQIPGALKVVTDRSTPNEFIRVQRKLQERKTNAEQCGELLLFYYDIRNKLVHGTNFAQTAVGCLKFEHQRKPYIIDYDTLAFAYHLLPSVLVQLYDACRSGQPNVSN